MQMYTASMQMDKAHHGTNCPFWVLKDPGIDTVYIARAGYKNSGGLIDVPRRTADVGGFWGFKGVSMKPELLKRRKILRYYTISSGAAAVNTA